MMEEASAGPGVGALITPGTFVIHIDYFFCAILEWGIVS